jgi:hypothetical protein
MPFPSAGPEGTTSKHMLYLVVAGSEDGNSPALRVPIVAFRTSPRLPD